MFIFVSISIFHFRNLHFCSISFPYFSRSLSETVIIRYTLFFYFGIDVVNELVDVFEFLEHGLFDFLLLGSSLLFVVSAVILVFVALFFQV